MAETRARGHSPLRILAELWSVRAVDPALQARTLAAISSLGSATCAPVVDRLGRVGLAVAADEAALQMAFRYVVVLSEQTGDLLAVEEVALDPADWLPKDPPCTVSYTAFVTSGPVAAMGTRPTAGLRLN